MTALGAPRSNGTRRSRREEIVEAAGRLFSSRGYRSTTVRDIAAACDLRVASLYSHFASKEEILTELVVGYYDELLPRLRAVATTPGTGASRISGLVEASLVVSLSRPFEFMAPFEEWAGISSSRRMGAVVVAREEAMEMARRALHEGIEDGTLRPDLDVETTLRLIVVGLAGIVDHRFAYFSPGRGFDPTAPFVDFVMRSLRP